MMNRQRPLFLGIACSFVVLTCRLIHANLGDLDPFFNPNLNGGVSALVVQPDGRILIGGFFTQVNGTDRPGFARLYPDGSLDTSFDPAEWPTASPGSLAVRPDGRIIAGKGFGRLLELHPDGSVLSGGPIIKEDVEEDDPDNRTSVRDVLLQPDGKVLFTGYFTIVNGFRRSGLARLNANETVDESFNPVIDYGNRVSSLWHIALQKDGKILISGDFLRVNGDPRNGFARLNSDGTTDITFSRAAEALDSGEHFALQEDSKILMAGGARLNEDGNLDSSFDSAFSWANPIVCQPDGKILVAMSSTLWRLNSDGSRDKDFNTTVEGPDQAYINFVAVQPDGNVLIAGAFTNVNGVPRTSIARVIGQPGNEVSVGAIHQEGAEFGLELKSVSSRNVTIEASTNLVDWVPVQALSVGNDPIQFRDTNHIRFPHRIYRASWQ